MVLMWKRTLFLYMRVFLMSNYFLLRFLTLGLQILLIILSLSRYLRLFLVLRRTSSLAPAGNLYEMTPTCGSFAPTKWLEGVYPILNFNLFSPFVTLMLVEAILERRKPLLRFLRVDFIGLHCLRMHMLFAYLVIVVSVQVT